MPCSLAGSFMCTEPHVVIIQTNAVVIHTNYVFLKIADMLITYMRY